MIKIRYADLPEGLHIQTRARGRHTIIFLRPGLTSRERRESLRRALRNSHVGYGPPISAAGLTWAVAVDRVRGTLGNTAAAVRWHPLGSLMAVAACGTMVASYMLLVSASVQIAPAPVLQIAPLPESHPVAGPVLPTRQRHDPATRRADPKRALVPTIPAPSPARTGASTSPPQSPPAPSPPPSPSPTTLCIRVGPLGVCL